MDFKSLQRKAKQLIDRRGGTDSLRADAEELKDIAREQEVAEAAFGVDLALRRGCTGRSSRRRSPSAGR